MILQPEIDASRSLGSKSPKASKPESKQTTPTTAPLPNYFPVNLSAVSIEEVERDFCGKNGSLWLQKDSNAPRIWLTDANGGVGTEGATAIVVAFRNRSAQLSIFLRHMHSFMPTQGTPFTIFIVEQVSRRHFSLQLKLTTEARRTR